MPRAKPKWGGESRKPKSAGDMPAGIESRIRETLAGRSADETAQMLLSCRWAADAYFRAIAERESQSSRTQGEKTEAAKEIRKRAGAMKQALSSDMGGVEPHVRTVLVNRCGWHDFERQRVDVLRILEDIAEAVDIEHGVLDLIAWEHKRKGRKHKGALLDPRETVAIFIKDAYLEDLGERPAGYAGGDWGESVYALLVDAVLEWCEGRKVPPSVLGHLVAWAASFEPNSDTHVQK